MHDRPESIRPCCGTLTDRTAPSPHARDCPDVKPSATIGGGPYCIAARCTIERLHRAGINGCAVTD